MKKSVIFVCFVFGMSLVATTGLADTRDIMNVWHIPTNQEPTGVTMRNPVIPAEGDGFVYFYCGGHPQSTIWAGTVYYRIQGVVDWSSDVFAFDTNEGANEYWIAMVDNSGFIESDSVEYYLAMEGDSVGGVDPTFLYGDDTHSNATIVESEAQAAPYTYTLAGPRPTPTQTGTPGPPPLLNVWHIPVNNEPPVGGVTMRTPLYPSDMDDTVYIYGGAHPTGAAATGGTLYWREATEITWNEETFTFDSTHGDNEYWLVSVALDTYTDGDNLLYYIKMLASPGMNTDTFIYGDDDESYTTGDESTAQGSPYSFVIGTVPTATPTPDITATPTGPTPQPTLNVWHIPINEEPPGTTMRNPLFPSDAVDTVSIYCGGFPSDTIWSGTLFYRASGAPAWTSADFAWDSTHEPNVFFLAELSNMTYAPDTVVQYYLSLEGDPGLSVTTYVYGADDTSMVTDDEGTAQASAFEYTVGWSSPTYTPTPVNHTPTPPGPTHTPPPQIPTATPTSGPHSLGVRIVMPSTDYGPGDTCYCTVYTDNPGDTIPGIKLFVLLDVGIGEYWFWPSWNHYPPDVDYMDINLEPGSQPYTILPEFNWPSGAGSASGIQFLGALVDAGMTSTIGNMGLWQFGWHD